jgi:hypothetical protein
MKDFRKIHTAIGVGDREARRTEEAGRMAAIVSLR